MSMFPDTATVLDRPDEATGVARPWHGPLLAVTAGAAVGALGAGQGGYFPAAWGWAGFAFLGLAAVAIGFRAHIALERADAAFLAILVALTAWIGLSTAWSTTAAGSVDELERTIVYAAAVTAALVAVRGREVRSLLGGILAAIAIVCTYSLATRLFPERLGSFDALAVNRLSQPLGYWNGLGLFAAMGFVLVLGWTPRRHAVAAGAAVAAALPVLATTLYFTFSRGGWIALGAGLVVSLAVTRSRLRLATRILLLAPPTVVALVLAAHSKGLTARYASLGAAEHDGHRLALAVVLLALLSAAIAAAAAAVEARLRISRRITRAYAVALVVAAVALLAAVFVSRGTPVELARRAYDQFTAPPVRTTNLNTRLFSLSNNGRTALWHAAWRDYTDHPLLGSGAGSFEPYWYRHRPPGGQPVRDAHSLYLETLAELGPVGLALLVGALVVPLALLRRARHHPLVAGAAGAYAAYLVHASFDWDWELPAVTVTALLCGVAIIVAARRLGDAQRAPVSWRLRGALLAALLVPIGFSFVALIGNSALSASASAIGTHNLGEAHAQALKARFWAPWSPRPWQLLAESESGPDAARRAVADLQRAVAKDPGSWQLWRELAAYATGRVRRDALARARQLDPLGG